MHSPLWEKGGWLWGSRHLWTNTEIGYSYPPGLCTLWQACNQMAAEPVHRVHRPDDDCSENSELSVIFVSSRRLWKGFAP